jgi:hypothetical protein
VQLIRFLSLVAVAAWSVEAGAQIMRLPRSTDPGSFLTLAIGLRQQQPVTDGSTSSSWDFGQGIEYRGTLEHNMRGGTTVGVAVTHANMPLTYRSTLVATDAHATVRSYMFTVHGGGTRGFHQVFDIGAGITRYSNFRRDQDDQVIAGAPATDNDLTFALGYGLGYAFSSRSQVTLVQEYGLVIHQNEGLSGSASRSSQTYITRIGMRIGMGSRRR